MPSGIIICGANGCGKTTLGAALAERLKIKAMDIEDYCFESSDIPYTKPRSHDACISLILSDIYKCGAFVISAVKGNFGEEITSMYKLAVVLSVPKEVRMARIEQREYIKFGGRVLPGGDMYAQQQEFYEFARTRDLSVIDEWIKTLTCPVLRLDGTNPIDENVERIIKELDKIGFKAE